MNGLLDTSVFIGQEQERDLAPLPDAGAISVMTLAELHVGVLVAAGTKVRAQRLRTLARVEGTFEAIPVDDAVARIFAAIVADAKKKRRHPRVVDALIGATAVAHRLPLYSQDRDFALMPGVELKIV